jgi:glycosyltransferase involved in cell wall biosynthesis
VRAAVYNQHLRTMGGGERYSAMLADVLSGMPEISSVELLGHGSVSRTELEGHLGLALPGITLRLVPDRGEDWLSELTAEYDLFVNASYMSRVVSRAARSSYAVYFPTPCDHDLTRAQKGLNRLLGSYARGGTRYDFGLGWFPPEGGRRRSWSWTSGEAEVSLPAGDVTALVLKVGRPGAPGPTTLVLEHEGVPLAAQVVSPGGFGIVRAEVPGSDHPRLVQLRSETFVPPPPDQRELGVAVAGIGVGSARTSPRRWLASRLPYLLRDSGDLSFLDSYDQVLSISEYTAEWVQRLWGRPSEVLYPPVHTSATPGAVKQQQVLSIGRFFGADRGHSKKQLEMVRAFAGAQDRGQLQGWEYHLVGGCSPEDEPYLEEVRRAGAGHAVHVHANAPRALVQELLSTASLFWHATGLDEDPAARPWAMEHFGITTVEAMAAGCVPVVIRLAGQREIVRDGVDGFLFDSLGELVARSVALAEDPQQRSALAQAGVARADAFSEHAFADRCGALVRALVSP